MNVSESIDWRHAKPWELDLHRFIAITNSGQTLDGWLKYFPRAYGYWTIQDSDFFTDIFRPDPKDKTISLYTGAFKSINVLKETRKPCKERTAES